jgi:ribonuclease HII
LRDSKLLTKQQREKILDLLSNCCNFGEGWVYAAEIDKLGLADALRLGFARALTALNVLIEEKIIIDGKINYAPQIYIQAKTVIGADQTVPLVSAASIYAKVARDRFMTKLAKKYPVYGFERHVGYGTANHRRALSRFGTLQGVHRISYKPVSDLRLSG